MKLKQQAAAYEYLFDYLTTQAALLVKQEGAMRKRSEAEREERDRRYEIMTKLLKSMSDSFDRAVVADPALFTRVWEKFKFLLKKHPGKSALFLTFASTPLALYGFAGNAVGLNFHLSGLSAWLCNVFGWHFALQLAGCGLFVGLALVTAVALIDFARHTYKTWNSRDSEVDAIAAQKELDEAIERLKTEEFPVEQLMKLRDAYERAYLLPIQEPKADDTCIICLRGFTQSDGEHCNTSVRQLGCRKAHFLHEECHEEWAARSSSFKCIRCDPLLATQDRINRVS